MKCKLCKQASRDLITHPTLVCRACVAACCSAFAARDRELRDNYDELCGLADALAEQRPESSEVLQVLRLRDEYERVGVPCVAQLWPGI
jgi:hypothetical protein